VSVYYVAESDLVKWLAGLPDRSVYAPQATGTGAWVSGFDPDKGAPALDKARAAQSTKSFLMPPAETVARYGGSSRPVAVAEQPLALVGVRACELRAWKYLDKVMLEGEFVDPPYKARRESAAMISCDCVACAETCCCTLVGGRPYVEPGDGADVNITALDGGYLLEPMTDAGAKLIGPGWAEASDGQLAQRDGLRQDMVEKIEAQNARFTFSATDGAAPDLPEGDDDAWQRHAADCVECGACTNICPTCHCFYLFDHALADKGAERVRTWDSCLLSTYHRMAGGPQMKLSPRPELRSRLANRILHKFVYSPQQWGMLGCVGCGRCVDACLGAIDIRDVVEDLKR